MLWFATNGHCLYLLKDSVHIRFPGIRRPNLYPNNKDYTIYRSIYCVYFKYRDLCKTTRKAARIITVFTRHILLREMHSMNTTSKVSLVIYNTVIVCWACVAAQCYISLIALIYSNTHRKSISCKAKGLSLRQRAYYLWFIWLPELADILFFL